MAAGPMPPGAPMPGAPSPAMPGGPPAPAGPPPGAMAPPGPPQPPTTQPAGPAPQPPQKPPVTIDAVMALLRDDRMRGFRVDVQTDQLVEADEQADKAQRMEFVGAIGGLLGQAMQLEANPAAAALMPAVGETIMFAVRGFRAGRQLEETFETALEKAAMLIAQPKPPQQDPKAAIQVEAEKLKLQGTQLKVQAEQRKAEMDIVGKQVEQQDDFARLQMDRERMVAEGQRDERTAQREERMAAIEALFTEREHTMEMQRMSQQAMLGPMAQPGGFR